jgi:hypothetical protein
VNCALQKVSGDLRLHLAVRDLLFGRHSSQVNLLFCGKAASILK